MFVDLNGEWIKSIKKFTENRSDCSYYTGDVKLLNLDHAAYITPANSLLFMDAGIDRFYTREMFPDTEKKFREIVKKHGKKSLVNKSYLPIGDAIMISPKKNKYLIAAPTMLMPQPVQFTRNAYYATLAGISLCKTLPDITIVIPAMCCGWGKMKESSAAIQVWWAILDAESGNQNGKYEKGNDYFVYKSSFSTLHEQPLYYENTEFKQIEAILITTNRSPDSTP